MNLDLSKYRCPQRQAIIDADEFIQQCQRDGLTPKQVLNTLLTFDPKNWDDVRKLVVGDRIIKQLENK